MKVTLLKISLILIFLLSYCTFETIAINRFSDDLQELILKIQYEKTSNQMNETYHEIQSYMDENQILLDLIMTKNEQEIITVSLGRIRDYLAEDNVAEAHVAAGEIGSYLVDINAPFVIKK